MAVYPTKFTTPTTATTLHSTDLNSLPNADGVLGSEVTLTDQYGDFEFNVTTGSAPATGAILSLWLLAKADGVNYEDGSDPGTIVRPARAADVVVPLRAVATAQRVTIRGVLLPNCPWKPFLVNDSGVAFAASGSTVKVFSYSDSVVV